MFQILVSTSSGEQTIEVDKDCYRFGKSSEIVLPVTEDHCATVYRRNGQFHFSNRSASECKLGRRTVQPNESVVWAPEKNVEFTQGITLRLKVVRERDEKIKNLLSLETAKKTLHFDQDENQIVDDKVVALLCGGLLFFSLIKFLATLA